MKRRLTAACVAVAALLGAAPEMAVGETVHADLTGYEEVPAVSTGASGEFRARISRDETAIEFALTYEGIEGGNVLFAHIHVGQLSVNGGVSAFLCGGGGKPACPSPSGTVEGTILPADVLGPGGAQQVPPGALDELVAAIRADAAYVNVHSDVSPGGEIRGQIRR
jgi:hypothetical protein